MMKFNLFDIEPSDVMGDNKFYDFREAVKLLNKKELGRNNLLKLLRDKGIFDRYNDPVDEWEHCGFFKQADNYFRTTLISTYGINYIKRKFL